MSIRIENDRIGSAATGPERIDQVSTPPEGTSQPLAAASQGQGQDQIDVSPATARLSSELSAQSATRAGRVQQLATLYAGGQYRMDSTQIGQSMVAGAL